MSDIRDQLARMTPEERAALLAEVRQKRHVDAGSVQRRKSNAPIPLSSAQERLWIVEKLDPDHVNQNIAGVMMVEGDLNVNRLRHAMLSVQKRHEILRTAIQVRDDEPKQVVLAEPVLDYKYVDLHEGKPAGSEEANGNLNVLLRDMAVRKFDMASGCMLRMCVVRTGERSHSILVSMHHMVGDGGSISLMIHELWAAYLDRSSELPKPAVQYGDYAIWQRQQLGRDPEGKAMSWWRQVLDGMSHRLQLEPCRKRPAVLTATSSRRSMEIPPDVAAAVQKVAAAMEVTPFHVYIAAYAVVLMRFGAGDDFAIGVPVSLRTRPELQPLIGCFLNMLPVRMDMRDSPSFGEVVRRARQHMLSAMEHMDTPFEEIVSNLCPERDTAYSPLFQATFSFERAPEAEVQIAPGLSCRFRELALGNSSYDFSLELNQDGHDISGWMDYGTDLYDESYVDQLLECFLTILQKGIEAQDTPVDRLVMLAEHTCRRLTVTWNEGDDRYPDMAVHKLFSGQANAHPDSVALVTDSARMSYAELDERSGKLATLLQDQGVRPGDLVGLCLNRSLFAVQAMLAVLKCGAAYVPLDIGQPLVRIQEIYRDACPRLVVADTDLVGALSDDVGLAYLDEAWLIDRLDQDVIEPLSGVRVDPDQLAYVMFTSGSTGKPKGVRIAHRSIARLVLNTDYADFGPDHVGLLLAPLAFDASTFEIWGQLLNGGTLAIAPPGLLGFDQIGQQIADHRVDTLWLTAGLFQGMVEESLPALSSLRQLLTGGDVLPRLQVQKFLNAFPEIRLINGYGPTEGTTFTCCHTISPADLEGASIPIGRRIANTRIYVLDRYMTPVPPGVIGELFIGGDGVAHGYMNDQVLTAASFMQDPFSSQTDARLYRTGDLVRYRADGVVEFHGRADHQIKLRGFRIEAGEIESVISSLPGVSEAALILRNDGPGGAKRLCAYVVPRDMASAPSSAWVRQQLRERLPDYMIPSTITLIETMPLTTNGKVDRKALPIPAEEVAEAMPILCAGSEPEGTIERALAELWCGLLNRDSVGRYDSFFALGGDSILIIQLVARARSAGLTFSATDVFAYPVLTDLADVIEQRSRRAAMDNEAELEDVSTGEVPMLPVQAWFFQVLPDAPARWNQWLVTPVTADIPVQAQMDILTRCLMQHDVLRLRYHRNPSSGWAQSLDEQPRVSVDVFPLPDIDRSSARAALLDRLNEMQVGLDLENGPLLHATFILGPDEGTVRLALVAHHLIVDMVSWFNLLEHFRADCQAYLAGRESSHASVVSFSAWARALDWKMRDIGIDRLRAFWIGHDWQHAVGLPPDDPVGPNLESSSTFHEGRVHLADIFDPSVLNGLEAVGSPWKAVLDTAGLRMPELLAISLAHALNSLSGVDVACFEMESSGRGVFHGLPDNSQTMGWYTLMYPVALSMTGPDVLECVENAQAALQEFEHHALDLAWIRFCAPPDNRMKDLPEAGIVLNYLGEFDEAGLEFGMTASEEVCARDPHAARTHEIVMDVRLVDDMLKVGYAYGRFRYRTETISRLHEGIVLGMRRIVQAVFSDRELTLPRADLALAGIGRRDYFRVVDRCERISSTKDGMLEDILPLTPLQHGLLFHGLSHPGSDHYLIQFHCVLEGELDADRLKHACRLLLERHPALRASFHHEGLPHPVQAILHMDDIEWTEAGQDVGLDEAQWRTWLEEDRRRGMDIDGWPLHRFALIHMASGESRFVWTHHHVLMDGWSLASVVKELFTLYEGNDSNVAPEGACGATFRDYLSVLQTLPRDEAVRMWKGHLQGIPGGRPLLRMVDTHETSEDRNAMTSLSLELGLTEEETGLLRRACGSAGVTLATTLQAAYGLVLASLGMGGDVVFGNTVSGRNIALDGIDDVIGLCINTIPMRVSIEPHQNVVTWLQSVQRSKAMMTPHEWVGLADIQRALGLGRHDSLFEAALVIENYPMDASMASDTAAPLRVHGFGTEEHVPFPLELMIIPERGIRLRLFHDAKYFGGRTPGALLNGLLNWMRSILVHWAREGMAGTVAALLESLGWPAPVECNTLSVAGTASGGSTGSDQGRNSISTSGTESELTEQIARIWADLLEMDSCPMDVDFFDLGGQSLLILQMRNRLMEQLGVEVSVVDLLQYPTVTALSNFLRRENDDSAVVKGSLSRAKRRSSRRRARAHAGHP